MTNEEAVALREILEAKDKELKEARKALYNCMEAREYFRTQLNTIKDKETKKKKDTSFKVEYLVRTAVKEIE